MSIYQQLLLWSLLVFFLKVVLVGSDFSFFHWVKYGREYREWYTQRETWEMFLKRQKEVRRILELNKGMWGLPIVLNREKQINKAIQEAIEENE